MNILQRIGKKKTLRAASSEELRAEIQEDLHRFVLDCQTKIVNLLIDRDVHEFGWLGRSNFQNAAGVNRGNIEWWLVTPWLARELGSVGETVLCNSYGNWWGSSIGSGKGGIPILDEHAFDAVAEQLVHAGYSVDSYTENIHQCYEDDPEVTTMEEEYERWCLCDEPDDEHQE